MNKLTPLEIADIRIIVKKYEKFSNLYNNLELNSAIDSLTKAILHKLNMGNDKYEEVKMQIEDIYILSEGLSIIMNPYYSMEYNNIDNIQKIQY